MSKAADDNVERLEEQLEQADSEPPSIEAAHERLGTEPAGSDEFAVLAAEMGPPDREG